MEIVIFQQEENLEESLGSFRDLFYSSQMKYFASDLLQKGLSLTEIQRAVRKAMTICQTAEMEVRQHFIPVYTEVEGTLVNDCKLSQLGYGLVLLNASETIPVVARWQLKVMSDLLN